VTPSCARTKRPRLTIPALMDTLSGMRTSLLIALIAVSVLLSVAVLLQSRGTGIGATFGGDGNVYRTKRGLEKGLFYATIVLTIAFLGLALALVMLPA
jgi:preprotein translocase subunit SecG